jgi:hypothetical protein
MILLAAQAILAASNIGQKMVKHGLTNSGIVGQDRRIQAAGGRLPTIGYKGHAL